MLDITSIEKAINLLDGCKLEELRELLSYEREKAILKSNGGNTKLYTTVKKIIDKITRDDLRGIMIDENGIQWLCNSFLLVKWKINKPELRCLEKPKTPCINLEKLLCRPSSDIFNITDDEKIIIRNLDKYIKLYKVKKDPIVPVCLFGTVVDAVLVKQVIDIIGTAFICYLRSKDKSIKIITDEAETLFLPLRDNPEFAEKVEARTKEFITKINNKED